MSKTTLKADEINGAEQVSVVSKEARNRINIRMTQNILLVWLDSNIDENKTDYKNTITQLRRSVNNISIFTDGDLCLQFIENITNEKICLVISGALSRAIVPRLHDMFQVDSIFIFCGDTKRHESWTKDWCKIKGVFTDVIPICEALKQAAHQCERNAISISFMSTNSGNSKNNLDQLDCSFMYTQILKEILLSITFEQEHFQQFIDYCQKQLAANDYELKNVKKFDKEYHHQTPIWWYTYECFLYPMLNRALRTMDAALIVNMGFYIGDLHRHIEQLHLQQFGGPHSGDIFTVYRGQGLLEVDFAKLMTTKGGLIAFNNFLSTSKDRSVSLRFARSSLTNPDTVGILFVMSINPTQLTTPFASITEVGCYGDKENEVLFSMNSIFRIRAIHPIGDNQRLYQVDLTLTNNEDKDLLALTARIREDTEGSTGWFRLGELLRKMGQIDKAEEVYQVLLDRTADVSIKAPLYGQLGLIKDARGEHKEAIALFEKALAIHQKTLPKHHLSLATAYNSIGMSYRNMGENSKALSYYLRDLEISEKILPANHPDLGGSYNNIGVVYSEMCEYPKALSYYKQALEIQQQSLPPNHPSLGMSYNNIGVVYKSMGDYSTALSYYEKDLEILRRSLPSNHPDLGMSYNNIGMVYERMGDHSKARSFYECAVDIAQRSLPSNHPDFQEYKANLEHAKKKL